MALKITYWWRHKTFSTILYYTFTVYTRFIKGHNPKVNTYEILNTFAIRECVHSSLYLLILRKVYVYVIYQLFCNIRDLLNLSWILSKLVAFSYSVTRKEITIRPKAISLNTYIEFSLNSPTILQMRAAENG
jgi:hypothetical protein